MNDVIDIAEDIRRFAQEHELKIHPGQDPESWAELVVRKDGCPCVPGRKDCPCEFVLQDIAKFNRCRCGLFVNDAYIAEYTCLADKYIN